jgi:hypothetical protein
VLGAFWIRLDRLHLTALDALSRVEIADRRVTRRTAAPGLFMQALFRLVAEVLRIELGDRSHDPVDERPGRSVVDRLRGGHEYGTGFMDGQPDGHVVCAVAGQTIDLVDDDVIDIALIRQPLQESLQRRAIC